MGVDIKAFDAATAPSLGRGIVMLSKDKKSLESVGTGKLGGMRLMFLSSGERHSETRLALFNAVRESFSQTPVSDKLKSFLQRIMKKLDLNLDDTGAPVKGEKLVDKPLESRVVRQVLNMVANERGSLVGDPVWMSPIRQRVGEATWLREDMSSKLRQDGWSLDDRLRKVVVDAMLKDSKTSAPQSSSEPTKTETATAKEAQLKPTTPPVPERNALLETMTKALSPLADLPADDNNTYGDGLEQCFDQFRGNVSGYFKANLVDQGRLKPLDSVKEKNLGSTAVSEERRKVFVDFLKAKTCDFTLDLTDTKSAPLKAPVYFEAECTAMGEILSYLPDEICRLLDEKDHAKLAANLVAVHSLVSRIAQDNGLLHETLPTEATEIKAKPLHLTGGDLKSRCSNTIYDPKLVKSVKDNPSDGHCFFYSALDQMGKTYADGQMSAADAKALRKALIDHEIDLLNRAKKAEGLKLSEHGLRFCNGMWSVPTCAGRVGVESVVNQLKEESFKGSAHAEVKHGAFLADLLKRPVVIVGEEVPNGKLTFDRDLENGKQLEGNPIVIYHTPHHFRAAELADAQKV